MTKFEEFIDTFREEETAPEPKDPPGYVPPEKIEKQEEAALLTRAGTLLAKLDELPELTSLQRHIAYWLSRKTPPSEVAWRVGCSAAYVRMMREDPRVEEMVTFFRSKKLIEFFDDLSPEEMIDRAQIAAVERLAELMFIGTDAVQLGAAKEIAKLGGSGKQDDDKVTIVLGNDLLETWKAAKAEVQEADYEIEED